MSSFQQLYDKVAAAIGHDPGKYIEHDESEMVIDHEGRTYRIVIKEVHVIDFCQGDFPRGGRPGTASPE